MKHSPLTKSLVAVLAAALLVACNAFSSKNDNNDAATTPTDSTDIPLTEACDSVVADRMHDAQMLWLSGAVSKVLTTRSEATLQGDHYEAGATKDSSVYAEFDRTGRMLHDPWGNKYVYDRQGRFVEGNHTYSTLERDSLGRIVVYSDALPDTDSESNYVITFSYDNKGRLDLLSYGGWTEVFETRYTYDANSRLAMETTSGSFEGGGSFSVTRQYDYRQFDQKGNWTLRLVIENSEELDPDDQPEESEERMYFEHRVISYEP